MSVRMGDKMYQGIIVAVHSDGQTFTEDGAPTNAPDLPENITYDWELWSNQDSVGVFQNVAPTQTRLLDGFRLRPARVGDPCHIFLQGGEWKMQVHEGLYVQPCEEEA